MAKLDIKSAFRICPVRPADWHLLGFVFQNLYFVDLRLPFGLPSSVNRFTQVSDTLSWIMKTNYHITNSTHYLDDFLLAGPKESRNCHTNMQTTINLFDKLACSIRWTPRPQDPRPQDPGPQTPRPPTPDPRNR